MNSTPTSLRVFGWYLILVPAVGLIFMPDFILNLFGLRHGPELWLPRVVGLLAGIIGVMNLLTARYQLTVIYPWSIRLRSFAALFMIALWLMKDVEIGILAFAAIDALGALWTWWTLRQKVST